MTTALICFALGAALGELTRRIVNAAADAADARRAADNAAHTIQLKNQECSR